MLCPKCGKELKVMWKEDWKSAGRVVSTSVVGRCEDCDFDGTWDIDIDGNEINFRQFFFG